MCKSLSSHFIRKLNLSYMALTGPWRSTHATGTWARTQSGATWGLRLGGTETRKRNQDKWAIEEVKGFSAIDFRVFGEDEQTSTFLFLPAFVPAFSEMCSSG